MPRIVKAACPHCDAPLKSTRGVRAGKTITCPRCGVAFTVTGAQAAVVPVGLPGAPAPRLNGSRLILVLLGMLLYLSGGTVLALYCFTIDAPKTPPAAEIIDAPPGGPGDAGLPLAAPALPTVSVPTAEQRKINDAIVKGVWFLRDHQQGNGSWNNDLPVGYAALGGLTLLECDVPADDPAVQKAAAFVREQSAKLARTYDNYQRSLSILFLDRLGDAKDQPLIQSLALCLIAGQHPTDGGWTYSSPALDRARVPQLLARLADKSQSLGSWRKTALNGQTFEINGWDNSNTQFAILALWAARHHGVRIDPSIALVEKHFRTTQLPSGPDPKGNNLNLDGSWLYNTVENSSAWPSMTAAGLLGLAMAHGADLNTQQKPLDDPAIKRGLAMLAREIDRTGDPRGPDYYFLWSLERVGVLYNLKKIDGKDWYAWGCKVLLPRQQADGSWKDGGYYGNTPVLDTCFVLLFLKQANLARDLTTKLQLLAGKK